MGVVRAFRPVPVQEKKESKFVLIPRGDSGKGSTVCSTARDMPDKKHHATPSRQLFVGNIEASVSEETIKRLFERFGTVAEIRSYIPRGYAFVTYERTKVAVWVREQMSLYPPILGNRPLAVNFGRQPQGKNVNRAGYEVHVHNKVRADRRRNSATSATSDSDSVSSVASSQGRWVFVNL